MFLIILLLAVIMETISLQPIDHNMFKTYHDLANKLLNKRISGNQYWVGVAGPPGSGKSTLTAAVSGLINEQYGSPVSIVIPMDGYHLTRAALKQKAESSNGQYTFEDLIARRGAQWTFDPINLVKDLKQAKQMKTGMFPIYDRKISDPVPNQLELKPSHEIVLVEGNYLLTFDDPEWAPLKDIFDEKWFITCPSMEIITQRLITRHLETWSEEKTRMWGPGEEGARKKAEANDILNAQYIVSASQQYADIIIDSI